MLGMLIESKKERDRREGGTMVSVLIHSAIVSAAILATAKPSVGRLRPETPRVIIVAPHAPPKPRDQEQHPVSRAPRPVLGTPSLFRLDPPRFIPPTIPDIDLSLPATTNEFNEARAQTPGCYRLCGGDPAGSDTATSTFLTGSELAMRLRQAPTPPRYPEALRSAGVEGSVTVRFVVDTTGRVDMSSVEVVSSTHDLFTAAVRDALRRLSFFPSEINGKRVRAAAQMPFLFTLK